jgi:uncharacterized damage-inducible protein DinB
MVVSPDARASLAADLDAEIRLTRGILTRVPAASLGWAPHPKSFTLGGLTTHLANLPHWGTRILTADGYDLATATGRHPALTSREDILGTFDRHVDEVAHALMTQPLGALQSEWVLRRGAAVVLALSRADALRRFLLHHLIHHRGQLTVYLRLLDVPLPPLYGPTADEPL